FLESDDLWDRDKLSAVQETLRAEPDAVAVQHGMRQVDAALRPLPTWLARADARWALADFLAGRALLGGVSALSVPRAPVGEAPPPARGPRDVRGRVSAAAAAERGGLAPLSAPLG